MSPTVRRHKAFVASLAQLLIVRLAGRAIVWVQSGVVLSNDTEPEPDISVLRQRAVPYEERDANAENVLLLVEVADARSPTTGPPSIKVYRTPSPEGYRDVARLAGSATFIPDAFPDVNVTTAEIFA